MHSRRHGIRTAVARSLRFQGFEQGLQLGEVSEVLFAAGRSLGSDESPEVEYPYFAPDTGLRIESALA